MSFSPIELPTVANYKKGGTTPCLRLALKSPPLRYRYELPIKKLEWEGGVHSKWTYHIVSGKHHKLRVGGCTDRWFNHLLARAHLSAKLANCQGVPNQFCPYFIKVTRSNSGESCNVQQSVPTHSLVAKFLKCSVVTCSTQTSCCRGRRLRTRPQTGLCQPDVMAPKAHQNYRSYVSSADLPSDSLHKDLAWWMVTKRTLKKYKTTKIGGWALACPGQYGISVCLQHLDNTTLQGIPDLPDCPPMTGLLSKWSMRSSTVDNLPKLKLKSFRST